MNLNFRGHIIIFIVSFAFSSVFAVCPSSWSEHNGRCYFFSSQSYRITDAYIICNQRNASLLTYRDDSDWKFISNQVVQGTRTQYWLDLRVINGTWNWRDGSPYNKSMVHWYGNKEGVTNRRYYECASFRSYKPYAGSLYIMNCNAGQRVVCQKPNDAYELCDSSNGWELVNKACYKFYETKSNWFDARATCQRDGGDLYLPTTYRMVNSIGDLITCRTTEEQAWIGISDTNQPGYFKTTTNQTLRYQAFYSYGKVIMKRGGTCVFSNPLGNFFWETDLCTEEKKFICEKQAGVCQPGWSIHADNCYQLVDVASYEASWFLADQFCKNQNTQLVHITDSSEDQFVASMLQNQQLQSAWIGFSDIQHDNTLSWTDGTPVSGHYTNWYVGYPKPIANKTDCGQVLVGNARSAWTHGYCYNNKPFICKAKVITTVTLNTTQPPVTSHCDDGWIHFRGECYYFGVSTNSSGYSWSDARRMCFQQNAELTTVRDPYEQSFIAQNQLDISTAWIGLKYHDEYKTYLWVDQSRVTFSNYYPGEPDDLINGEECIKIMGGRKDYMGAWDDANCTSLLDFICRKQALPGGPSATPAPTTIGTWSYRCGPGWTFNTINNYCYQIVLGKPKTWSDAQWDCQRMNSSLLSIEGPREQAFVQAMLSIGPYAKIQYNFWMGGSDISREGGWEWADPTIPFAYLNWHPGEPNEYGVGEDCMEIVPTWNYQWNDKRCDHEQQYICKKSALQLTTTPGSPTQPTLQSCTPTPMISGNYSLLDDTQLVASSSMDAQHQPYNARIYPGSVGGWSAQSIRAGEYIQVSFYDVVIMKGVMTMGRSDADEYVTQYQLRYQYDTFSKWVWYEEPPGKTKTFIGNTRNQFAVTNSFLFPIEAKSLRLYPTQWHNRISLRWDVLGCMEVKCRPDYGVSGPLVVPQSAITVSSMSDPYHNGNAARIRPIDINTVPKGWEAKIDDSNQWIKVDLGKAMIIRGISTMGSPTKQEWVTSYMVSYSTGTVNHYYQEPYGTNLNIPGNTDNIHKATYFFKGHFQARYISIIPRTFHGSIALRFDVLVCQHGCNAEPLITGPHTKVPDDSITASTSLSNEQNPGRSRLNQPGQGNIAGAWSAKFNDRNQYIQVDLSTRIQVVAVATQGRQDRPEWIKTYTLSYSQDGVKWYPYDAFTRTPIVFEGNFDQNSVRKQYLSIPFVARYVRLWPRDYQRRMSLRWEVYGCPGPDSGLRVGCFADNPQDRDLPYEPFTDPSVGMWPPMCVHHCFEKGYYYAGLQAQYKCFCGNSYGRYGPASDSQCSVPCYPGTNFKCGGKTSNSIYTTGLTAANKICKPNWKDYAGSCYLLLLDRRSWGDARAECQKQGADLVTINSQAEQDLIYSVVNNGGGKDVWIGLNDMREENLFEWVRGDRVKFTNWNVNQPRQPPSIEEDCVVINPQTGGWQDENCDNKHQYVCQADKMTSNQPTTPRTVQGCPKGWDGYRWSCYLYVEMARAFSGAHDACRDNKATLVQIDDKFEQSYLSSVLGMRSGMYWTDVTDLRSPGTYQNIDNTLPYLAFSNWGGQQPTGLTSRCVAMNSGKKSGLWFDIPCNNTAKAVCEAHRMGYTAPTLPPTTTPTTPCPTGWVDINGYCYQVNQVPQNKQLFFDEAITDCANQGATLASFHNKTDFNTLWTQYLLPKATGGNYWIGLDDRKMIGNQKVYRWLDRSPLDFTQWAPNQPDNHKGQEDCVEVWAGYMGYWNDNNCYARRNWICKIKKGNQVTPRTTPYAPTAGSGIACGNDLNWKMYKGNCYYVVDGVGAQSKSWREARRWCQGHSADLISITTVFVQLFIQNQIANTTAFSFWTGLSETAFDLGYKWSDGSPASFINWNKGEPNDFFGPEDCVEIMVYTGKWNDAHCADKKGFICEKSLAAKPSATPSPAIQGYCPTGFSGYGNKCYKIFTAQPLTWDDASNACRRLGTDKYYLASINSPLENAFVTTLLGDMLSTPWIGLSRAPNQKYRWVDNEDLVYTNWYHGEPNGQSGSRMCVRMYSYQHSAGEWDDFLCNQTMAYICETKRKKYITTPEPIPNPCDSKQGFKPYGNDCLLYVSAPKNWHDANAYCLTKGAYLSTISDAYEQAYLFLAINDPTISNRIATWIGLSDKGNGTYKWANPLWPVLYTNWKAGEPSRMAGEGCIALNVDGQWSDEQCNATKPFVCQITTALPPVSPPPPNEQCPGHSWVLNGTKCYLFKMGTPLSFIDATIDCQRRRANLVSIHSVRENKFLVDMTKAYSTESEGFWTSFHKSPQAGFEWFDGSPKNYLNWDVNEPSGTSHSRNNADENCVEVRSWNGKWNDLSCTLKRAYICETIPVIDNKINTMPSAPSATTPPPSPSATTHIMTISPPRVPTKAPTQGPTATPHVVPKTSGTPAHHNTLRPPATTSAPGVRGNTDKQTGTSNPQKSGLSGGALAGILITVIVLAVVAVVTMVMVKRRRRSSIPSLSFENTTYDVTNGKVQLTNQNGSNNVSKFLDDETES